MSSIAEAGEVIHIAKSGRLILKIGNGIELKPGENLFDNAGKKVGRVTELIGPVAAAYASVLLADTQGVNCLDFRLRETCHQRLERRHDRLEARDVDTAEPKPNGVNYPYPVILYPWLSFLVDYRPLCSRGCVFPFRTYGQQL